MAFHGKTALITGGASGMGREMALRLAAQGAQVAIVDQDPANLARAAAEHPNLHPYCCDVTDLQQVNTVVAQIVAELGPIDRLAHAAGIMPGNTILDTPTEQLTRVTQINYFGTVHLVKAVLPPMLERRQGDIIVFGSITGFAFARRLAAYCASKAAVNAFTEVLIHECRETPLRVLLVCPPAVNTPLISQATATGPAGIRAAATSQKMATPGAIIDAIEAGIDARKEVIFPGEARMIYWMRRLSPRLLWWLADKSEPK